MQTVLTESQVIDMGELTNENINNFVIFANDRKEATTLQILVPPETAISMKLHPKKGTQK